MDLHLPFCGVPALLHRVPPPCPSDRSRPSGAAAAVSPLLVPLSLSAAVSPRSRAGARLARLARQRLREQSEAVAKYRRGDRSEEFDTGVSTGYRSLDQFLRPVRGEVIVVSGQPGSGKSEFLLSVAVNLAKTQGWKHGLCSFEHKNDQLLLQLLEKKLAKNVEEMSADSFQEDSEDVAWINQHFQSVCDFSSELDLSTILSRARELAEEGRLHNLIIDPYNYISKPWSQVPQRETELVSSYMTQLQQFAKKYQVCVWIVVHPTKGSQQKQKDGNQNTFDGPSLYDLQGSAHWNNKCDKGILLRRPNKDPNEGSTRPLEIHVCKVRNGESGQIGVGHLVFEPYTRSYREVVPECV